MLGKLWVKEHEKSCFTIGLFRAFNMLVCMIPDNGHMQYSPHLFNHGILHVK